MKETLIIILFLFTSCNNIKDQFNPKSVELNNQAIKMMQQGMMSDGREKEEYYSKALNLFDKAIEIDSSLINSYDNKINILVDLSRYNEAIEVLDLKLIRQPDLAEGYFLLGLLFEAISDTVNGYKFYNKSIDLFEERISQGKMVEVNEINLAGSYIMINEEEKGNKLLEKYLSDEKYGFTAEILYKSKREEIINQTLQNKNGLSQIP